MTAKLISSQRNQNNLSSADLPKKNSSHIPADKFETAEDMALVELISPVSAGGDALHITHRER